MSAQGRGFTLARGRGKFPEAVSSLPTLQHKAARNSLKCLPFQDLFQLPSLQSVQQSIADQLLMWNRETGIPGQYLHEL